MELVELAKTCKALGDPTRARIFSFLLECSCRVAVGEDGEVRPAVGPTVGDVCCHVTGIDRVTSTVSFHLKELREAGLISMEKQGKYFLCAINQEQVKRLAAYFESAANLSVQCC